MSVLGEVLGGFEGGCWCFGGSLWKGWVDERETRQQPVIIRQGRVFIKEKKRF